MTARAAEDARPVHGLERGVERIGQRGSPFALVATCGIKGVMVAQQDDRLGSAPEVVAGEVADVVGDQTAVVESAPCRKQPALGRAPPAAPVVLRDQQPLLCGRRSQQPVHARRLRVVAAHHRAVLGAETAMNDRVDHRIQRQVLRGRELGGALGVPQQHMQELVADHRLHLRLGAAVLADERQVHEQPRPLVAGHGQRRHRVGELGLQDLEHRADRQRVVVDQLPANSVKFTGCHA
ncbi:MAG: hypothetical protein CK533_11525 [Acidobacterium sp.]|nr:MAG: hypothetical protein CK533_11525 [Acidobacterium sp.]